MKINSINNINTFKTANKAQSFKGLPVAYPEYKDAYVYKRDNTLIDNVITKLTKLFSPEVTKEATQIKNSIDNVFENPYYYLKLNNNVSAEQALLTVLA